MQAIIWYGAGKNLSDYEQEFLKETGYPVCICDNSEEKQGTEYIFIKGEKRKIVSLEYAISEYPNFELWLTLADHNSEKVYQYLIDKGIQGEKIRLFGNRELRMGCENLNYYCYVGSQDVKTCAHYPYTTLVTYNNEVVTEQDVVGALDKLEEWRKDTINKLRKGEQTTCQGCSGLRWGIWTKEPKVRTFAVGPSFSDATRCNANCFYCNQNQLIHNSKNNQILSNYDIHRIASEYYDSIKEIILADGEPTILPSFNKTVDLAQRKGWVIQLNTNGIIYDDTIANVISSHRSSFIAVSLDSGSKETYKKIKRVDKFDLVVDNLIKYSNKKCNINLKYILMQNFNDSIEEINAFINICKKINCSHVTLSQNLSGYIDGNRLKKDPNMPEELFCLFSYFIARLQEENIYWDFQIEFITKHDYERLEWLRR